MSNKETYGIYLVPNESDFQALASLLQKLCEADYSDAVDLTIKDLYNNAKGKYTPVGQSTASHKGGQLKRSASADYTNHRFGYSASYAPHVEFGHRTRNGGYVEGQHYLQRNVETVRPQFKERIIKMLKEYGK